MNKTKIERLWVTSGILVTIAVVFFIVKRDPNQFLTKFAQKSSPNLVTQKKARKILSEPLKIEPYKETVKDPNSLNGPSTAPNIDPSETTQVCEFEFQKLLQLSAESWLHQASEESGALDPKCLSLLGTLLGDKSLLDNIRKCLANSILEDQSIKPTDSCIEFSLMFRALAVEYLFRKDIDYASQSEEVLLNRILAGFGSSAQTPKKINELIRMTDALVDKDPKSYPAQKARASLLFLNQANFSQGNQKSIDEALDRCAELNPQDLEIQESRIALPVLFGNPNEMDARADELLRTNPDNPIGLYFRAGAHWQAGNAEESILTLTKLVKIAPNVIRYNSTLEKIRTAKPKEKGLFSVSMSISLLNE